jgi:hypothetical protein
MQSALCATPGIDAYSPHQAKSLLPTQEWVGLVLRSRHGDGNQDADAGRGSLDAGASIGARLVMLESSHD